MRRSGGTGTRNGMEDRHDRFWKAAPPAAGRVARTPAGAARCRAALRVRSRRRSLGPLGGGEGSGRRAAARPPGRARAGRGGGQPAQPRVG